MMLAEASADAPDLSAAPSLTLLAIFTSTLLDAPGSCAVALPSFDGVQPIVASLLKLLCRVQEMTCPDATCHNLQLHSHHKYRSFAIIMAITPGRASSTACHQHACQWRWCAGQSSAPWPRMLARTLAWRSDASRNLSQPVPIDATARFKAVSLPRLQRILSNCRVSALIQQEWPPHASSLVAGWCNRRAKRTQPVHRNWLFVLVPSA